MSNLEREMETKQLQWTFVDKTEWPEGPWQQEPDKVQWVDPATNLDCLIHRGPSGGLCGYVGLPPGHKFHGKDYNEVSGCIVEDDYGTWFPKVHGGLTFADRCDEMPRADGGGICHIPEPGRPTDVWWLGFDCAHSGDLCPSPRRHFNDLGEQYRTLAYVRTECERLAKQLHEAV